MKHFWLIGIVLALTGCRHKELWMGGEHFATIEVNFDVTRKNMGTGEYYSYLGNTLSAPLTTTNVYEWQAGKIYTYNITLDLKQIKVTADVVDWLDAGEDVVMDN